MTDLDMTKLCAEAMGLKFIVSHDRYSNSNFVELNSGRDPGNEGAYDPLHDDAQAMALVKKCHLHIDTFSDGTWLVDGGWHGKIERIDPDLNRAIVECVAKMQAGKQPPIINS